MFTFDLSPLAWLFAAVCIVGGLGLVGFGSFIVYHLLRMP